MPIDSDARQYANDLFEAKREELSKRSDDERVRVTADFNKRGMLQSGSFVQALVKIYLANTEELVKARADSLLLAYEKSGVPFDDQALREITAEVTKLCESQQRNVIAAASQIVQRSFRGAPAGMSSSIKNTIEREGEIITARIGRELRIKRSELRLEENRAKKVYSAGMGKLWDVFISHASEDKEEFVRPLSQALQAKGLGVWYDETSLKVGDSLRQKIDEGLAHSRFGVVVLSPNFFVKRWPQHELDGLFSREVEGVKVILPVWHNIDADAVRQASPLLASKIAARSHDGLSEVVRQLLDAMGISEIGEPRQTDDGREVHSGG